MKTQDMAGRMVVPWGGKQGVQMLCFCHQSVLAKSLIRSVKVVGGMILAEEAVDLEARLRADDGLAEIEAAVLEEQESSGQEETLVVEEPGQFAFGNVDYAIDLPGYESASYGPVKSYYETIMEDGSPGASFSYTHDAYAQAMDDVQEVARSVKAFRETNRPYVEAYLDSGVKHVKENVKFTVGLGTWFVMCEGKLQFN